MQLIDLLLTVDNSSIVSVIQDRHEILAITKPRKNGFALAHDVLQAKVTNIKVLEYDLQVIIEMEK